MDHWCLNPNRGNPMADANQATDITPKIAEAASKIADLQKERAERLASADNLEKEARADRARAMECKKEVGEWTTVLNSLQVRKTVEDHQAAAARAHAEADQRLKEAEKTKAEAIGLLESARSAIAANAAKADQAKPESAKPE